MVVGELKSRSLRNPLVVTDKGVSGMGFFSDYISFLKSEDLNVSVFDGIFGNPVKSQVTAGVKAFKDSGADSVIAIGGGAALDVAKVIALLATNPGDLFDYEDGKPDALPVDNDLPFLVAIPTTAGTGSDVGRSSVISEADIFIRPFLGFCIM